MATINEVLSSLTAITITLDSLSSSATAGRASTVVDNSSNLFIDALVSGKIVIPAGTPGNEKTVYLYAYGLTDPGPGYTDGVTGSDAAYSLLAAGNTNLRPLGAVMVPTGGRTYQFGPFSVAASFGGILPSAWGVAVVNYTGLTLGSGNAVYYAGLTASVA